MTPLASCQKSGKAVRPVHRQSNRRTRVLGGAALVLGLLLASAEAATPLQADQYSGVSFDETDLPPLNKEFEFTVPDTSTATLRVTELGCPGDAFTVTSGTDVLFQTSPVPAENSCRDPFFLASAADAFADPAYSTGSIDLSAGTYLVRVSPVSGATPAAIGFFINDRSTVSTAEQSSTASSVSEQPTLSDGSSTENPTAVTLTITDQVTETATVPDSITDAPTATESTAEENPVTSATGISMVTKVTEETPIEASTKPALPVVTTTSFTTTTVTVTNPVTLTSGNATTTTFVVATETVSAIPTLDVVTLTVETILVNTLTVIGNRTIGGITLTSTAVVTQTEVVTVLPTTTVPPSGVTTEYVTTEVTTSLDDIPTNLPAPTENATETLYITQYETVIVTGAASEQTETMTSTKTSHATTVEPETSASDTAKPSVGSPTSHLSATASCTVPVVTETAIITLTSTVVRFTDKLPSISTAFATATVKGVTTVTKIPTDPVGTAVPRVGSQGAAKEMTPSKWLPTWITRFFPRSVERVRAAKVEPTYDVVTVTAEAPTRIVTVSENCEVTPVTSMAPSLTTEIESSTTDLGTASEPTTSKISTIVPETTISSETGLTTEISDSTTVEPETSTAITSAEVSETSASEVPTPTDIITSSVSATAEPSSTTESAPPSTTTDSTPSFTAVLARCNGRSPYLSIITSPSYPYKDANEACSSFGYGLAKISSFKETMDANAILVDCQIDHVWIKASSANMVNLPQCYAISQDQIYEPDNCENGVMQVLCATP